jgi:phosphoglucomutase
MQIRQLLDDARNGFKTLSVGEKHQHQALKFLETWLFDEQFSDYVPQIQHLITEKHWDYLLDSFYQVIPFGTGGRRGEVGVGPNRINPWTIKASAQGHSQYLLKHYGEDAKSRGVVLAYDVRQFFSNQFFDNTLPNPVKDLTSRKLAESAAEVYAANGLTVYFFEDVRTTPELSFAVPFLKAVGGDVFSASHNPPEHNGKKVYDEFGGQLIPPFDEALVTEVTEGVKEIKEIGFDEAKEQGTIKLIGEEVDKAYVEAMISISLSSERDIKIAFTPLHGCGSTSVLKALRKLGYEVAEDPKTSNPSGRFENVTFNIPNPEVIQSFDVPLQFAKEISADVLLNSDPDADRVGIMASHHGEWVFFNGNEIAVMIAEYIIGKRKEVGKSGGVVVKTTVTTDLVKTICENNGVGIIGDLMVGYKYIGEEMKKLDDSGKIDEFLFGVEESHGYNAYYTRDKDAASAAVWLMELAAEQKKIGRTLVDYLNDIYAKYGYFKNYLTEIRMPGAEGKMLIDKISDQLRANPPSQIGRFMVEKVADHWDDLPIVSETDRASKNVMSFYLKPVEGTILIKVTVRPSGTEPKTKMYFEIGSAPFELSKIDEVKGKIEELRSEIEREFMKACYKIIGVDFPDRGFLLFWQLPLPIKMKYFEIEPEIIKLKEIGDRADQETFFLLDIAILNLMEN